MKTKRNQKLTILFGTLIGLLVLSILILSIVAISNAGARKDSPTASPETTEEFDVNTVVVREDPVIMTVDQTPVKFSEFQYFYHIAANEILEELEFPEGADTAARAAVIKEALKNGIEGKSFDALLLEKTKNYCIRYIQYRKDYLAEGFALNQTYLLYLQSNFMPAASMEELEEKNAALLKQYGVVRNEYISILVYNDALEAYRKQLREKADYSEEELRAEYEGSREFFSYKGLRVISLDKKDMELAKQLKAKIESGYHMSALVGEYSTSATKDSNKGLLEGNPEDFTEKKIADWLKTAVLNEVAILELDTGIYVIRYENDGAFERRKQQVSDYKAVKDYEREIEKKVTDGEIRVIMMDEIVTRLERPAFLKQYEQQ